MRSFRVATTQVRHLRRDMLNARKWALEQTARDGLRFAILRSSGPLTLKQRVAMDYPFAKRHPAPLVDPSIINQGTGAFRRDWRNTFDPFGGASIINENPVADFLKFGTRAMHDRPAEDVILKFCEEQAIKNLARQIARVGT